jgi:hypothetical protein
MRKLAKLYIILEDYNMEKKIFDTLVKKDHMFGNNNYVIGRIHGMMEVICDGNEDGFNKPELCLWHIPGVGDVMTTYCEPGKYESFKNLVEKHYPNLCEFNYDMSTVE